MVSKLDILILSDDRHFYLGPFTPHHFTPRYPQTPETRINATKKTPSPQLYICKNSAFSASSGVRTLDTLIKSQVLYQLS